MTIRAEIHRIEERIRQAAGANAPLETFFYQGKPLSDLCKALPRYLNAEKSLTGRVETLSSLSNTLGQLAKREEQHKSSIQKVLGLFGWERSSAEKKLDAVIAKVSESAPGFSLKRLFEGCVHYGCTWIIHGALWAMDRSLTYRIKECAFRILKDLSLFEQCWLDASLNGAPPCLPIRHLKEDLIAFRDLNRKHWSAKELSEIEEMLSQLEFAFRIADERQVLNVQGKLWGLGSSLADLAYEIETKIEQLPVGQSIAIPGGYFSDRSGHGVIYEIKRTGRHSYQFHLINTGEGAGFGQGWVGKFRMMWNHRVRVVCFKDLSEEVVLQSPFWIELLRLGIQNNAEHSMERVLALLQEQFGQAEQGLLEEHELQTWGSCAFACVMAYLQTKLSKHLFLAFQMFLVHRTSERLQELLPLARAGRTFETATLELIEQKNRSAVLEQKQIYQQLAQEEKWDVARSVVRRLKRRSLQEYVDILLRKQGRLERRIGSWWFSHWRADPELVAKRQAVSKRLGELKNLFMQEGLARRLDTDAAALEPVLREKTRIAALFSAS